jgi:sugar phosphate isomerase/epimerase
MMQLGFVTAILPELDFQEVLRHAAEIGYDCVEVMCWPVSKAERRYAGVTHIDVTDFSDEDVARVRQIVDSSGVQISALGYYPNPLSPDRQEAERGVEHLRRVIEASQKLGIGKVNSFVGRDWKLSVEDNWPRFLETWRPIVAYAADHGVQIGIENCPMLFSYDEWPGGKNMATSPAIWRRMFDAIPDSHFGLNYDPSHMIWQQMDYLAPIREFGDRLHHIHAKDVRIDRHRLNDVGILATPASYHTPKLPGMGDVNWGQFFSELTDTGYRGPVCVEVEDRAYEDSLASRLVSLKQSHTYLRNFVVRNELRTG